MTSRSVAMMAAACLAVALSGQAQARDIIQIAGSSTVLPFATVAAEQFGQAYRQFKTPIVESGGTTGGFTQFCSGVGENTIDIANASRPIRPAEIEACRTNGVTDIVQVRIGYDGIVFASRAGGPRFALTPRQLYLALAEKVPVNGQLVANPYTNWRQIDPSLPDQEIQLFIPAENHGTREVFEEKILLDGCKDFPEIKAIPAENNQRRNACRAVRKDGRSVDVAGDYTETLARIGSAPHAVGVFGLSFYDQNRDKVQVATIDGITPSIETIASGQYPVSRPLFFYVKKAHLGVIPGLQEYVLFFLSDRITGPEGMAVDKGLIPMPDEERAAERAAFLAGRPVGQ